MKYSVIMPVYNKADTVSESVKSILAQTEKDFELIIVNDGSTDDLQSALCDFSGITVIEQENGGVSVARNTGIAAASGEYICFLDADDLWLPNHLDELNTLIDAYPEAKMYSTSHSDTYSDGRVSHSSSKLADYPDRFLCDNLFLLLNTYSYSLFNTNCICINKSFMLENNILFEPGQKLGEDTDVWYRCALSTPIGVSKAETTVYRHENSTATLKGTGSPDWIFARRWENIKNESLKKERKEECFKLIERYKISTCLDYILNKDRKNALKWLRQVECHSKRYYLALVLAYLPYFISKWILTHR